MRDSEVMFNQMFFVISLSFLVLGCDSARILAMTLYNGPSHWMVMEPLFQELARRGHQMHVFTVFPQNPPLPNYTDVDFSHILPSIKSQFTLELIKSKAPNLWVTTFHIREVHEKTCKVLDEPEFQNLLTTKKRYDVIITELFGSDCFAYFAHKLKIPLISFTTSTMMPWAAERLGLPDNPSYINNYFANLSPHMNFWERTFNTIVVLYAKFWHLWVFPHTTRALTERSFKESLPPVHEVVANTSLLLVNSYHVLSQSRPFPPNVIEVGGIHVKAKQPISEDLRKILDNAKNGALVMSFGSLVRSAALPKHKIRMFMNVFAKIPQTVIFKFEDERLEVPSNVVVRKWLSQRDVIDHENVIALILHGGLGSTIEAVHVGKPVIGVPLFADQEVNVNGLVRRGAAVLLDFDDLSEGKIATAVSEIVNNSKYRENMKRLSLLFRDRPMTPLETAVFWVEYVIRHQGAPHLRPASVDLHLYQYLLLDVTAFLLLCLAAILYILYYILNIILFSLAGRKKKISDTNGRNKKNI